MARLLSYAASECRLIFRFVGVGLAATMVHLITAIALLEGTRMPPVAANMAAFLVAFLTSFAGNYFWTFGVRRHVRQALWRYLLVACAAFSINNIVLWCLLSFVGTDARISILLAAAVVPVGSYLLSRLWAFGGGPDQE